MDILNALGDIAKSCNGKIDEIGILPDNSGFATMSFPLRKDHWLLVDGFNEPPMPLRMGIENPDRKEWEEKLRLAAKYAIRASTMNGKLEDFDPDAMVGNFIIGMLGYYTGDGLLNI